MPNVLVLGLGNLLLSDEGVGVHAVEALRRHGALPAGVELVDGGTSGMDLLDTIAGRDRLIVVDAVRADAAPGTVVRLSGDAVQAFFRTRISPHQLGLCEVLATLSLTNETPQQVEIIGIVPEDLSLGLTLSSKVSAACERVVAEVISELRSYGLTVTANAAPAASPSPRH
ncbi:MAG: hydrogenase 2 maturation endopeptidase [Chloroflexi bacterium]|nr:MAG: hydrogenase 2 maturation endopeptidase [Chloroflexota bacterium]